MTSGQSMRIGFLGERPLVIFAIIIAGLVNGCTSPPPRQTLVAPYAQPQLWAVVPPVNESGVSIVDTPRMADMITQELQQTRGIDALPVNRVMQSMERWGAPSITTPEQVRALMTQLGVDGLIIGSITAYDPYPPITLGLALQLYLREPMKGAGAAPVEIARGTTGEIEIGQHQKFGAVANAAGVFDARDQQTRSWLDTYAASRHEVESGFEEGIYLVSMDLFTKFVSHRLLRELLVEEQFRVRPMVANNAER